VLAPERDLSPAEPDRVLFPALIRVAPGLLERRAGHAATEPTLFSELAGLLGEAKRPAPPSAEPPWPSEPLTESETRALRTHMGAPNSTSRPTLSRPTCGTCTRSSAPTAAGRPCSTSGPEARSQRPPAGPRTMACQHADGRSPGRQQPRSGPKTPPEDREGCHRSPASWRRGCEQRDQRGAGTGHYTLRSRNEHQRHPGRRARQPRSTRHLKPAAHVH
jgi:hypothetical protein